MQCRARKKCDTAGTEIHVTHSRPALTFGTLPAARTSLPKISSSQTFASLLYPFNTFYFKLSKGSWIHGIWPVAFPGNLKELDMPEQSPADRYYKWTRTCFIFVAVLMVIILTKFLTFGPRNYWPLVPLLPLPFLFLLNLWLAFRRVHRALPDNREFQDHSGQSIVEGLFGLALTGACGLLIALIVGFMIGKLLAH